MSPKNSGNPIMADLDAIRQAIEERDAAIRDTELLATEMVYHGNSVQWWHSKAIAYKTALGAAWDALNKAGVRSDGETDVATAIGRLGEVLACARAVVKSRGGDIHDEDRGDGSAATCDLGSMIRLETALDAFKSVPKKGPNNG